MNIVGLVTDTFSFLTVIADIIVIYSLIVLVTSILNKNYTKLRSNTLVKWIGKRGILLSFLAALVATLSSLFFSEIAGYDPCKLCWYQRIAMYPLALLLGIAWEKKDKHIIPYAIMLASIGAVIAAFHYYLQLAPTSPLVPCSTVGVSISCTTREFTHFGYVTIPMMSLTGFLLVIGSLWSYRLVNKN